jgi:asparagine synthase (glutamine-hydrolysing)
MLDIAALTTFFRFGTFVGETTAYSGVRSPNRPVIFTRPLDLNRDQIVDGYIELFRKAVAKLPDGVLPDGVLLLSGGRDYQHILLELLRAGRKPVCCFCPSLSAQSG